MVAKQVAIFRVGMCPTWLLCSQSSYNRSAPNRHASVLGQLGHVAQSANCTGSMAPTTSKRHSSCSTFTRRVYSTVLGRQDCGCGLRSTWILADASFTNPSLSLSLSTFCKLVGGAGCKWWRLCQLIWIFISQSRPRRLGLLPTTTRSSKFSCWSWYSTSTHTAPKTFTCIGTQVHCGFLPWRGCAFRPEIAVHSFTDTGG